MKLAMLACLQVELGGPFIAYTLRAMVKLKDRQICDVYSSNYFCQKIPLENTKFPGNPPAAFLRS